MSHLQTGTPFTLELVNSTGYLDFDDPISVAGNSVVMVRKLGYDSFSPVLYPFVRFWQWNVGFFFFQRMGESAAWLHVSLKQIKYSENTFVVRCHPSEFILLIIVTSIFNHILSFVPQFVASLVMLAWIFVLVAGYRVAINMVDAME